MFAVYNGALYFRVLSVLRPYRLLGAWHRLKEHSCVLEENSTSVKFLELGALILLSAHFWSCGFILIGRENSAAENSWTQHFTQGGGELYVNAIYFAIISMTTIGYGDITPQNSTEKLYVILMAIVSSGNFAYTVNTIGQIFAEQAQKEARLRQERGVLRRYMLERSVAAGLQAKALTQLSLVDRRDDESMSQALRILSKLSPDVTNEMHQQFFGRLLQHSLFTSTNFSADFLTQLSLRMREKVLLPGELLLEQGVDDGTLQIVRHGSIQMFAQHDGVRKLIFEGEVSPGLRLRTTEAKQLARIK